MNSRKVLLRLVMLAAVMLAACASAEVSISNARMAHDSAGTNATSQFLDTDIFYVVADLNDAPEGTVVKAVWSAVNSGGTELINESSRTIEESNFVGPIYFQLNTDTRWPAGNYQVELFLDDTPVEALTFTVE